MSKQPKKEASSKASTPRERVADLMQRLARASAFGGAALGLAAVESCNTPMVCDPLPPPISCSNPTRTQLENAMAFDAEWRSAGDAGGLNVVLEIIVSGRPQVTFSKALTLTQATPGAVSAGTSWLTVELVPNAGARTVTVVASFDCSSVTDTLQLTLDLSAPPAAGVSVPVTLVSP